VANDFTISVQPQPRVAKWLHEELQIACLHLNAESNVPDLDQGNLYVAIIVDESHPFIYKRAVVLSTRKGGLCIMADVLLVDSGDVITLPRFRLRDFPPSAINFKNILPQVCEFIIICY
jgi:hypothetical protein